MKLADFVNRAASGIGPWRRGLRSSVLIAALLLAGRSSAVSAEEKTVPPIDAGPVVLVLDASGSMAAALGGETRLDAARRVVLDTLSTFTLDRTVGLVAYGHRRKGDCSDIETLQPLAPVDPAAMRKSLAVLRARGKTPLSGALRHAAGLLPANGGTVMLVSDGLETCHEDPCAVVEALKQANANLIFHVVGFGLADGEMKGLACIAEKGGGQAIETRNATGLEEALKTLTAPQPAEAPKNGTAEAAAPAQTAPRPADPPPPIPRPVVLKAVVNGQAVPGPVLFSVTREGGEPAYAGKGAEVTPNLVPGSYILDVTGGNTRTHTALTVRGEADERHDIPLDAGLVRLSVIAAEGLEVRDADLKGNPVWTLAPEEGQEPATLEGVLTPETMLAPGRYAVTVSLGGFAASASIDVVAGKDLRSTLDLQLGKVTLEASLPAAAEPLETGAGLSWTLAPGGADGPALKAEAVARPTFLVAAGQYRAQLQVSGATIEQEVAAAAGKTTTVHLDLPSAELRLEGGLGPDAAAFTDWRDASWTVRPVKLVGDAEAGPALEDKAEASPALTLMPGEWAVTLVSGAASVTRHLVLAPGATAHERLDLVAGRLTISAAPDEAAKPSLNVLISIFAATADGSFAEKPVLEVGTPRDYSAVLPAGRYRIDAVDEQGRKASADVSLPAGGSEAIALPIR